MSERLRILVTGASGNVGAGVLRALARQEPTAELIGVCRRPPPTVGMYAGMRWFAIDLSSPDAAARLAPAMRDVHAVIHLALAVRPVDDEEYLYRANVLGTEAVLAAMANAGVRQLVYASSLGIYAPNSSALPVTESWPTTGQPSSTYSRHKVAVETLLDQFERFQPGTAVARFRPTVVVQREAAYEIRSLYLGPWVPRAVLRGLRGRMLPILPLPRDLSLQFVHADDVGDAVVRLMQQRARGSFNVASDVLDHTALADLVGARAVGVSPPLMRAVVVALHRLHMVAVTPGWYDVATRTPLMDTAKARRELDWSPTRTSTDAALELLDGLADGVVGPSAALGYGLGDHNGGSAWVHRVHDVTLLLWCAAAVMRALKPGRPGRVHTAVIAANLAAGTPGAVARVRQRRRDPVALLAPVAVGAAVLSSLRGSPLALAATTVLGVLGIAERRRTTTEVSDE